jgi:rubrerythrin
MQCTMCLLHKQGPCSSYADKFFDTIELQTKYSKDSKTYKKLEQREHEYWDELKACMTRDEQTIQLYEDRFSEIAEKTNTTLKKE